MLVTQKYLSSRYFIGKTTFYSIEHISLARIMMMHNFYLSATSFYLMYFMPKCFISSMGVVFARYLFRVYRYFLFSSTIRLLIWPSPSDIRPELCCSFVLDKILCASQITTIQMGVTFSPQNAAFFRSLFLGKLCDNFAILAHLWEKVFTPEIFLMEIRISNFTIFKKFQYC